MKLDRAVIEAYNRQWSMVNAFTVEFHLPPALINHIGGQIQDDINLSIISMTTPDFTNDPIEAYIANKWFIQNGKDALYRFSMTFRDYDQMGLYRKFMKIYNFAKEQYFDDVAMSVIVTKDGDWYNEEDKILINLDGTMVESVSNISFNNDTENQIAEFSVNFKSNQPVVIE